MKKALITGVTGQDGSYMAEFLADKNYEVHGIVRRSSSMNRGRIDHIDALKGKLHYGDLNDPSSLEKILFEVQPDEVYNLGAQSHVRISFDIPIDTSNITALGPLRLLEGVRKMSPDCRFYQASSSEMYGEICESPQSESTPLNPMSPYACSKVFAHNVVKNYRAAYDLHASNGILFNHESPRRGENFVTKKITLSLAKIKHGIKDKISLGNLDAKRDWGFAKDYVEAMWLMLQQDNPGDYVIGTGENHSVREFLEKSAKVVGLNIYSNGKEGTDEKYFDENGKIRVDIDPVYFRPSEVNSLLADFSKAKKFLGWEPKTKFDELIRIMVEHDLEVARKEALLIKHS